MRLDFRELARSRSAAMMFRFLLCGWVLAGSFGLARSENWPMWRGPRGDGTSLETSAPIHWSGTNNIVWKQELPGEGHSSPIIWEDRLFLTSALKDSQDRILLALDRKSGRVLWQKAVVRSPLEAKNSENSYASSTPATDGEKIFATFLDGKEVVVAAYDFGGQQRWVAHPGQYYSQHGFSQTPILFEDKVVVVCDSKGENFIVALARADGRIIWKVQRENPSQSYSPPLIRKMGDRVQMIVPGNKAVTSLDPANGHTLWTSDGPADDCVITPVYNERAGLVLSCSSWPKKILQAFRPDGTGKIDPSQVVWSSAEGAPYVPSPISVGEYFFTSAFANKEAYCFEAATGRVLWHEKLGLHHASPVSINGLIYFLNDDGVAHVIKAGPTYELVARNELFEKTYASPAISRGQIFLRGFKNLYCIGGESGGH